MKEMIYLDNYLKKPDVLDNGNYEGYNYWILSYGDHPCAYVELPKTHKYYGKEDVDAFELDIDVHCGITYGRDYLHDFVKDTSIIGWDYAHCWDYQGTLKDIFPNNKKWTTIEILNDVKNCIKQLKELENE